VCVLYTRASTTIIPRHPPCATMSSTNVRPPPPPTPFPFQGCTEVAQAWGPSLQHLSPNPNPNPNPLVTKP